MVNSYRQESKIEDNPPVHSIELAQSFSLVWYWTLLEHKILLCIHVGNEALKAVNT